MIAFNIYNAYQAEVDIGRFRGCADKRTYQLPTRSALLGE